MPHPTRTRRWIAVVTMAAATAMSAACSDTTTAQSDGSLGEGLGEFFDQLTTTPGPGQPGTTNPGDPPPPAEPPADGGQAQAERFKSCSLAWVDFPETMRPSEDTPGIPLPANPKLGYVNACQYDHPDGASYKETDPTKPYFGARVYWRDDAKTPKAGPGTQQRTWAGLQGALTPGSGDGAGKACTAAAVLPNNNGSGGVAIINTKFADVDPCEVADQLMRALTGQDG